MPEFMLRPGQVWEKDGKQREIVQFTTLNGREESSFYIAEDGLYDHLNVWWCRPGKGNRKITVAWCATWMSWWKGAKLVKGNTDAKHS